MGVEKECSKGAGGGNRGGFFHLFDWTSKSRKKLFSNKSDFPDRQTQGKKNNGNTLVTQLHLVEDDENGVCTSIKGGSDYSCASSVTDEDAYGAKAPSVVARLMGLDSLPMTNYPEPYSTPFSDTRSHQDAHLCKRSLGGYQEHEYMYSGYLLHKVEGPARNFAEPKPQRTLSKPIEKFQTEILPPKSAKSIPVTHHKLLSPIKSPAFIPSKNAAHIMEAAARIIEPGPQAMPPKSKMSHIGSSSVPLKLRDPREKVDSNQKMGSSGSTSSSLPLRVKDMKEKAETSIKTSRLMEASRRQAETNAVKNLKGQSLSKSWNGPLDTTSLKACNNTEDGSRIKNKGKSISLAIQAKVNVQRREGLNSNSSTCASFADQKEWMESSSTPPFRSQPSTQNNMQKRSSMHCASGVLRQNNQKQNCVPGKDKQSSKSLVSNLQGRKVLSSDTSSARSKISNSRTSGNTKTGSRKFGMDVTDGEKGISYYDAKNSPRKKRLIEGGFRLEGNQQVIDNVFPEKKQKAVRSKPNFRLAEDSSKGGSDVISFTFTTPLTRWMPCSEPSSHVEQKDCNRNKPFMNNRGKRPLLGADSLTFPSLGHNALDGDALSKLLEQKLKELSYAVEKSRQDSVKIEPASRYESASANLILALNPALTASSHERNSHVPVTDKLEGLCDSQFSSTNPSPLGCKHKIQRTEEMDECSSSCVDMRKLLNLRQPSPVSILEPTFSTESCSDSTDGSSMDGGKQCSSVQAQEVLGLNPMKKFCSADSEMDLSDSATSTSTGTLVKKDTNPTTSRPKQGKSRNLELEYVRQMLCNLEPMLKDFTLGKSHKVINSRLYDLLENKKEGFGVNLDDQRLNRKLLFDCVSECVDVRCKQQMGGGFRTWVKGVSMVKQKEWLAEEVYREISGLRGMGNCMVDELVDKDMSSQYGRWVDFEVDAFVVGEEIEAHLFDSLVGEVMVDFLKI